MNIMRTMSFTFSLLGVTFSLVSVSTAQVTVEGQVVSVDGAPLEADLTLVRPGPAVRIRYVHTDGQGRFSIRTDRTSGQLLVAKADSHVSSEVELDTTMALSLDIRFLLWPAGRVSGRVVDEHGNGVAGATVHVRYPGEQRRHHFHHESGDIRADDFGYFLLPGVARGRNFILESASVGRLPGSTAPLKLEGDVKRDVLAPIGKLGHVVRGTVSDSAARPHHRVMVRLRLFVRQEMATTTRFSRLHARLLNQRTFTEKDGSYEFKGLPSGRAAVIAYLPGRTPVKGERILPEQSSPGEVHVLDLRID